MSAVGSAAGDGNATMSGVSHPKCALDRTQLVLSGALAARERV